MPLGLRASVGAAPRDTPSATQSDGTHWEMNADGLEDVFNDETRPGSPSAAGTTLFFSAKELQAIVEVAQEGQALLAQPGSPSGSFGGQGLILSAQPDKMLEGGMALPLWPQADSGWEAQHWADNAGPGGKRSSTAPKPRLRWTPELHARFLAACNSHGGPERATPKQILVAMDVSGVTLRHVKSHLQKYRLAIKGGGGGTSKGGGGRGPGSGGGGSRKRGHTHSAGRDGGVSSGDEGVEEQCESEAALKEGGQTEPAKLRGHDIAGATTLDPGSAPPLPALQQQQQQGQQQQGQGQQGAEGHPEASSPNSGAAARDLSHPLLLPEADEQLASSNSPAPQQQSAARAARPFQQAGGEKEPAAKPPAEAGCTQPGSSAGDGAEEERRRQQRMLRALAEQQELQGQLQKALETQRQLQSKMLAHGRLIEGLLALGSGSGGGTPLPPAEPPSGAAQRDKGPPKLNRSGSGNSRRAKAPRLVLNASGGLSQTSQDEGGLPDAQLQAAAAAAPQRAPPAVPVATLVPSPFCSLQAMPPQHVQHAQQAPLSLPTECLDPTVVLARLAHGLPVHQVELAALLGPNSPLTPSQKDHVAIAAGLQQQAELPPASNDYTACLVPPNLSGSLAPQQAALCAQGQRQGQRWLDAPSDSNSQQAATTALSGRSACNPFGERLLSDGSQEAACAQLWPPPALVSWLGTTTLGTLRPASHGSPNPAASALTDFQQQQQHHQQAVMDLPCSQQLLPMEAEGQASDLLLDDSSVFDDELLLDAIL